MLIDRAEIATLVPHAGSMCLIDGVTAWDALTITCSSRSHRDPSHPLRRDGRLAGLNAIEYGAQAAAIHGGLIARSRAQVAAPAYLAGLKDVRLEVEFLDAIESALQIEARLLLADGNGAIYAFAITADGACVAGARVTILNRPDSRR